MHNTIFDILKKYIAKNLIMVIIIYDYLYIIRFKQEKYMNIIIAGSGKLGTMLTRMLVDEGHNITLIDDNSDVLEDNNEEYDILCVHGNCASMQTLRDAGIENADLLIVTTGADELNLLCCMTAHGMNKNLHTIARIRTPEYAESTYAMRRVFALSLTVNPERHAAREIYRLLKYPGFLKREKFANGRIEIVEIKIDEDSPLNNVPLHKMQKITNSQVIVCSVLRDGEIITPLGDFELKSGDKIYVTASPFNLNKMLKSLGMITKKIKNIVIAGGGSVCYYLAQFLEKDNFNVKIIERSQTRCEHLAEHFENMNIVQGDISSQQILEREGIENCDALISLTGIDEQNAILSIYANSFDVPKVITKLSRAEHMHIFESLPIGKIISPKILSCNTIVRYVRAMENQVGSAVTVHSIADGLAEAIEFIVDKSTYNCHVPLKDIELKPNVLLASITKGSRIEFATGDSTFEPGDRILIIRNGGKIIKQLNDIFEA